MKKLKILTVVGTRPEIIKLSEVIKLLDQHSEHILVHTGQNYDYELNEVFFEDLGLRKPDHFLEAIKGTAAETIGDIIAKSDKLIEKIDPDALLLYGDTNSCLCVISAKRRKVPIFQFVLLKITLDYECDLKYRNLLILFGLIHTLWL